MSELSRLIVRLQRGIARSASYIKTIRHPQLLVVSLQELNDLIGNDKVKDSVATQVSHLIMVKRRALENPIIKEDEVMLNAVLYGPPGVGKTLVGTKLAKIWYSLGYLDGSKNTKEKKQEIGDLIKDLFKDGAGLGTNNNSDDTTLVIYIMLIFIIVLITIISLSWSFYNKFGGLWTLAILILLVFIVFIVGYYVSNSISGANNSNNIDSKDIKSKGCNGKNCPINNKNNTHNPTGINNTNESNEYGNSPIIKDIPSDDEIIKVVTRADFVDRYVGWTSPKTIKLLEENLGKVLFVDEAYSLINGPHDEFGMEALTALNLFLSQRPKEIIVIFAGYKDLLQTGVYSVQPGLKRRFMWQFDCNGYTPSQLFEIFKMQLNKKGWGVNDEQTSLKIFQDNIDAFPAFGGDTDRLGFFAELEHSRDFISNETGMAINMLDPKHIRRGLIKLRENDIKDTTEESTNPLANMMKLISGPAKNSNKSTSSDANTISSLDQDLINTMRERSIDNVYR